MPERFVNLGVAEQNAAGFAAGMSLAGFKAYLYNIIPFVLYRCYEQVRNDICYQKLPVVLVGIGSGVTYAPQGMTHYSIEDIGIAQTLPNLTVLSPADPVEASLAARFSLAAEGPVYVRLAKRGEPVIHKSDTFDVSEPQMLEPGDGIAIVFHGSVAPEVLKARELLKKDGIIPRIISVPMVQPLAVEALMARLHGVKHAVCAEEHYAHCGLGSVISRACAVQEPSWKLHTLVSPGFHTRYKGYRRDAGTLRHIRRKDR